jgi:hypothetical protein
MLLVELSDELKCCPLFFILFFNLPEKERSNWIVTEDRIEQSLNLVRLPNKLTLDRRKEVVLID